GPGDPPQWRGCGSSAWVSPSDSERGSPSQVTREITTVPRIATFRRSTTPTTDRPQRVDESLQAAEAQLGDHRQDRHRQATDEHQDLDRKSTRLNSSHVKISYAVFCLKKKKHNNNTQK